MIIRTIGVGLTCWIGGHDHARTNSPNFGRCTVQVKVVTDQQPIREVTDARLDFDHFGSLRKSYVIASSYRCGSVYLSSRLWQTGVLGAPMTYLGSRHSLHPLMKRFKTVTPAAYVAALIARRSSRNGVFGMKEHFINFEGFIKEYPPFLEVMAPMTFIFISRADKVAQAVSMAKALQTGQWTSRMDSGPSRPVQYDGGLIANCIKEIALQDAHWERWFEANKIAPFELTYEGFSSDIDGTVRNIVELLGVQDDEPDMVEPPPTKKQSDETNEEWIERFRRDTRFNGEGKNGVVASDAYAVAAESSIERFQRDTGMSEEPRQRVARATPDDYTTGGGGRAWTERYRRATFGEPREEDIQPPASGASAGESNGAHATGAEPETAGDQQPSPSVPHFCDRHEQLIDNLPTGKESATGFIRAIRLRHRYDAIIGQNRALFAGARVLDLMRARGFWSLAALDAGAAHVTGVEPSRREIKAAKKNFAENGVNPASYRLIRSGIFDAIQRFDSDAFDIILCGFAEDCYLIEFFRHLIRLQPKHIIMDTKVRTAQGTTALFELTKGHKAIRLTPSHGLIEFLCEDEFALREVDWNAMGISHWTGVKGYATGRHRTYVLDRL
jgi:LPS sulfotransferase NodH